MDRLIAFTNWLQIIGLFLFCIVASLTPYIFFSVRRRFDPLFGQVSGSRNEMFHPFKRVMGYCFCLAAPWWAIRNKYIFKLYKGYDFRANSTKLQITLAWIFYYSSLFCGVFLFISAAIRYFLDLPISGMIDLPIS